MRLELHYAILRKLSYLIGICSSIAGIILFLNGIEFWEVWLPLISLICYIILDSWFGRVITKSYKHINASIQPEKHGTENAKIKLIQVAGGYFFVAIFAVAPASTLILKYMNDVLHQKSLALIAMICVLFLVPCARMIEFKKKVDALSTA